MVFGEQWMLFKISLKLETAVHKSNSSLLKARKCNGHQSSTPQTGREENATIQKVNTVAPHCEVGCGE
jgi:hypothetical protein